MTVALALLAASLISKGAEGGELDDLLQNIARFEFGGAQRQVVVQPVALLRGQWIIKTSVLGRRSGR